MDRIAYYYFNLDVMAKSLGPMLSGFAVTCLLAIVVIVVGISFGLALAVLRTVPSRLLRIPISIFVDVFRSLPPLVIIIVLYFALPEMGLSLSPFASTAVGLSLVLTAFIQESFWSSIVAVPRGQWEAARATGLGHFTTVFHVVLVPALKMAIPSVTNRTISITKGTALGSVVAVQDIIAQAQSMQSIFSNPSPLTMGALLYMALFGPLVIFSRWIEARFAWKH